MAGSTSDDHGALSRSSSFEGISSSQRCQAGDSIAEWRSSEQVENGTPSTSPPYWDTDDDDDDCGPKPSELYGKFTWKIENFPQINKRELRSNAFEVGGYKWYILIYPQGCDVCNHLSLFLCVANHDKLLPGWSHFAQFTIAVVNKDPKKSKYSDTLHRFWKKEHDWGWKKFMELSKVLDGFIVADTLVIKAQVQVIRERAHRPFRCLDCQYRRELVRVYLSNVEQICRRFIEERKGKLSKLIEDKVRWSSFRDFWLGVDHNARRRMSRDKADAILKVVVKHFFIEKEVTSTLVMDSLYSGLKALECQSKNKKGRAKLVAVDEMPAPIVRVEKDMFVLADDVLLMLERAALEPLPPKDDKGPQSQNQNRTKDGSSGEEFNKDSIERDERRLTELGRRTVEIFVLAHIFSRIEVAYQEAVALKRQEELIREEEAAGLAESELKAKRGAAEKEKRTKKKQAKQRRSSRKGKDRGRDEKSDVGVQNKSPMESPTGGRVTEDFSANQAHSALGKVDTLEDDSDVSDTGGDVSETLQPDFEDRDASTINWDTDTSEIHPATEASSSEIQNERVEKKSLSVVDDSSSTCSTDSVPSVVMNGPYKGSSSTNKSLVSSPSRGKNQHAKSSRDWTGHDTDNLPCDASTDAGRLRDATGSCRATGQEPDAVLSLKDRIQRLEQHLVEKEEQVVSLQRKLSFKDQVDVDGSSKLRTAESSSTPSSPMKDPSVSQLPKPTSEKSAATAEADPVRDPTSNSPSQTEKSVPVVTRSPQVPSISRPEAKKSTLPAKISPAHQVSAMSRPTSAPLISGPRPTAPLVSTVQTAPLLSRSVSATGRLGTDPSPSTHGHVPQSYRNAIMGKTTANACPATYPRHSTSSSSQALSYSQPSSSFVSPSSALSLQTSARKDQSTVRPGFTFGSVNPEVLHSRHQWTDDCSRQEASSSSSSVLYDSNLTNDIARLGIYGGFHQTTCYSDDVASNVTARQTQGVTLDEFPHLDIINYLLDEEHSIGKVAANGNGHPHHALNRQCTFSGDMSTADARPSNGSYWPDQYYEDGIQRVYGASGGSFNGRRDMVPPQVDLSAYTNGPINGVLQNQWQLRAADHSMLNLGPSEANGYPYQFPDYSNLAFGANGYTMYPPANGL